jgi:site-specific DNA-cytosine methylase
VASTLKSQDGRGWSHDAEATYVAGPLGGGNDGIGRRSQDDPNLVADTLRSHPRPGSNSNGNLAGVRRLTPTECERLQALPDGWTDLGGTPDSRRYAALGDAVTASVAEWIGRQLLGLEAEA